MHFLIYDLEATCWRGTPPHNVQEIIEIGAVKVNGYGEQVSQFNRFVRPKVNPRLSSFCTQLTGIEQSQVSTANPFPHVLDSFLEWAEVDYEDYLLISWGNEDQMLFRNDCRLHGLEFEWLAPHLNLKMAYKHLKGLPKPTGLARTVEREGLDFIGDPHRAIFDAVNAASIFVRYLDEWAY